MTSPLWMTTMTNVAFHRRWQHSTVTRDAPTSMLWDCTLGLPGWWFSSSFLLNIYKELGWPTASFSAVSDVFSSFRNTGCGKACTAERILQLLTPILMRLTKNNYCISILHPLVTWIWLEQNHFFPVIGWNETNNSVSERAEIMCYTLQKENIL